MGCIYFETPYIYMRAYTCIKTNMHLKIAQVKRKRKKKQRKKKIHLSLLKIHEYINEYLHIQTHRMHTYIIIIIIIIIRWRCSHGFPWLFLTIHPNHSSFPADFPNYIRGSHRAIDTQKYLH